MRPTVMDLCETYLKQHRAKARPRPRRRRHPTRQESSAPARAHMPSNSALFKVLRCCPFRCESQVSRPEAWRTAELDDNCFGSTQALDA